MINKKNIETGIFRLIRFGNFTGFTPSDKYWTKVRISQLICCECFCCELKGHIFRRWDCPNENIPHTHIFSLRHAHLSLYLSNPLFNLGYCDTDKRVSSICGHICNVQFSWRVFLLNLVKAL